MNKKKMDVLLCGRRVIASESLERRMDVGNLLVLVCWTNPYRTALV